MSGFGVCPKCGKKGMTRRGASMCTRCEKAAAQPTAVAVQETVAVVEPGAEEAVVAETFVVAEVPAETMREVIAESREREAAVEHVPAAEAAPVFPRKRYRRKNYIKAMGRMLILDDDEE